MTRCTRFENEGLIALEQGLPLEEHFYTCEVCIEEQRKYKALKALIHSSAEQNSLTPNWQQNVLDQITTQPTPNKVSKFKRWSYGSLAAGIATIGIVSLLLLQNSSVPVITEGFDQQIIAGDRTYRGEDAKVGDELSIIAYSKEFKYTQIRVYRNGRIYSSCGQQKSCGYDEKSNTLRVEIELAAIGEYQVVLISSNKHVEIENNNLDLDVLSARETEAQIILGKPINVQ